MRILWWIWRRRVHLEPQTEVSFIQIPFFRFLALRSIISQAALREGWLSSAQSSLVISQQHCFWHLFQTIKEKRTSEMVCCSVLYRVGNLTRGQRRCHQNSQVRKRSEVELKHDSTEFLTVLLYRKNHSFKEKKGSWLSSEVLIFSVTYTDGNSHTCTHAFEGGSYLKAADYKLTASERSLALIPMFP